MAITFDGQSRIIILDSTRISISTLWSRWVDWQLLSDNSKYLSAFRIIGGEVVDPSDGTTIPLYLFLENGWKIRPTEANQTLTIEGGSLYDFSGDPIIPTLGNHTVRLILKQPVAVVSNPLSQETINQIRDLSLIHGLIQGETLEVRANRRTAGTIVQNINDTGTIVTVARQ